MILKCSACSTRYAVDPVVLGPAGRTVRCARCGHFWFQEPPPLELDVAAANDSVPETSPIEEWREARRERANLPSLARKRRRHPAATAGWLALAAFIGVVAAGLWIGRNQLAEAWPPIASLYDFLGISVTGEPPGTGLAVVELSPRMVVEEGVNVLVLEGQVVNNSTQPRTVPGILVSLRDDADAVVEQWAVGLDVAELAPGERAAFNTRHVNPSQDAKRVEVLFTAPGQGQ